MSSDKIIGIDLGTTYSCVAVMEDGKPVVIANAEGNRTMPSIVGFSRTGDRIVGHLAKRQAVTNPSRTIQSVKREMGTNHRVSIDNVDYSPEQISAMILHKLRADAEAYFNEPITKAVITCPASFNGLQRQATRDAGQIAGLQVLRLINEPTASALAYRHNRTNQDETILVFDMGGGKIDVSIVQFTSNVTRVLASAGNYHLGGDDFDQALITWMKSEFHSKEGLDLSNDLMAVQRLKETAEKTKIELSTVMLSEIHLPFLTANDSGPKHLETSIHRFQFAALTVPLVITAMVCVEQALTDAGLTPDQIDNVLLVGGITRIPAVRDVITQYLKREPVKAINPDESVALGAAVLGSILTGGMQDESLADVTALSLCAGTAGVPVTKVFEQNTALPINKKGLTLTTTEDEQSSVEVYVFQGDRDLDQHSESRTTFLLGGIPEHPKGVPTIDVTFNIDTDGILHVCAQHTINGVDKSLATQRISGLSRADVDKMARDAQEGAQRDKEQREVMEAKVKGEALVADAERSLLKFKGKVAEKTLDKVSEALEEAKSALSSESTLVLKVAVNNLDRALFALTKAIMNKPSFDDEDPPAPPPQASGVPRRPCPTKGDTDIALPLPKPPEDEQ